MKTKRFYGKGLPGVDPALLNGTLIIIEGSDGSGRSTQIGFLTNWLERKGFPTVNVGLKRSELAGSALAEAMQGNTLNAITLNLFYATDFADQLERVMIPALKAGFVVLADRYIYTLMARDIVRGSSMDWLREIYGFALEPDAVFYLNVTPKLLAERHFSKSGLLDYWESGMDVQRAGGMYDNFIRYQTKLHKVFEALQKEYKFNTIQGSRRPASIAKESGKRWSASWPSGPTVSRAWRNPARPYQARRTPPPGSSWPPEPRTIIRINVRDSLGAG